ncbi:Mediator of RNA polymerase II transcription subunit [Drechslerella dactyloides]|uniref:Mediator of RNA polymerase II transcription subunit 16 n=1 Tax=Drechslerella dactyloides TaxID=74499 RepID=A0AAD6NI63_DREDA|nr:Mediator of RNA polymerase II transcription subunit [Drechslerella dactyloides]
MPGILMDSNLMGDLFEDNATTVRAIHEHIDLLRQGGCRQRIAWGKLGCIASIAANGTDVDIRHLMASTKDGVWILSPKYVFKNIHNGAPLASVHWNHIGSELAVADIYGRFAMLTVYVSVDRLNFMRQTSVTAKDDMSMLAGLWWLNMNKPYALSKAAVRQDGVFKYPTNSLPPMGPLNPILGRTACLGVTKNGVVKLWYASDGPSHILKATADLESYNSMDDIITHAAFAADKETDRTAVLAVYTQSKQLRVYRIAIDWKHPPVPQGQSITQLPIPVVIHTKRLKIEHCPGDGADGATSFLTHLEVLSPFPGNNTQYPIVLGFFVNTAQHQYVSTIKRWELRNVASSLHSSFDQMAQRRNSVVTEKDRFELISYDDVPLHKCALSVTQMNASTMVGITYSDGTYEMRDRMQFHSVQPTSNNDRLLNMIHAGWHFPLLGPYIDIALSPNYAAAALLTKENDVNLVLMTHHDALEGTPEENPNVLIAAVTLAQQHACSSNNHSNNDDLAAVARQYSNKHFITCVLLEAHRSLGQSIDFLQEQSNEKLQRNPFFQRCLSLQSALYYKGWASAKPIPAKISQATLHLKATSVGFGYFMNNVARNRQDLEDSKSNALQNLLGVVKWEIHFHVYVVDELLELARRVRSNPSDMELVKKIIQETNSCALPLILTGASRFLLKYNSRALRGFDQAARDHLAQTTVDEALKQGFQSLRTIMDANPVKFNLFEKLLIDIVAGIKETTSSWDAQQRIDVDRLIFLTGEIPPVFYPIVERFLQHSLGILKNDIDPSSIFFFDTTWLGFHDDRRSVAFRRTEKVDALRKCLLKKGTPTRRCLRCGEVVEDLVPTMKMGLWLQSVSRMCLCGSLWMHDAEDGEEAAVAGGVDAATAVAKAK